MEFRFVRFVHIAAILMMLLVISLPFTAALEISGVSASGSTGAANVVKPGDQVTVTANITTAAGDNLDAATLASLLTVGTDRPFQTCASGLVTGTYICTSTFGLPQSYSLSGVGYDVNYWSDKSLSAGATILDQLHSTFYVDTVPPSVRVGNLIQYGQNVSAVISVTDTAASSTTLCAGLGSLGLVWRTVSGDQPIPYSLANADVGNCSYTAGVLIDASNLPSGTRSLCAIATDRAGNFGPGCASINLNLSKPAISGITFATTAGPTTFIASGAGSAVSIWFNGSNADPSTYTVLVNGANAGAVSCDATGFCKTPQSFVIHDAGTYTITVSANTSVGVPITQSVTKQVAVDSIAPAFGSLSSNIGAAPQSFTTGSVLTVHFVENGVGMAGGQAALSLGSTSLGAPDNCTKSNQGWDCAWNTNNYIGSVGNVTATISGAADDLGNIMTSAATATLFYDNDAPAVNVATINTSLVNAGSSAGVPSGYFYSGSYVTVTVNATDNSSFKVIGNFSSFFPPYANTSEGSCSNGVCTIYRSPQLGVGPSSGMIALTFVDVLGNSVTVNTPAYQLLQTSSDQSVGNFTHSLTLTPSGLELTTFPYVNERAYARIDVRGTGSAIPLSVALSKCRNIPTLTFNSSGGVVSNNSVVGDTRLFNTAPTSTIVNQSEILLGFAFKATTPNQSNVQFLCDISVTGKLGDVFIPKETETVLINFTTYNMSVGEVGQNYQRKSDAFVKNAAKMGEKLATLEKLFTLLSKLCRIFRVLTSAYNLITFVSDIPETAAAPLHPTFFGSPIAWTLQRLSGNMCVVGEVADKAADNEWVSAVSGFCKVVNCELSIKDVVSSVKDNGLKTGLSDANKGLIAARANTIPGMTIAGNFTTTDILNGISPQDTLAGAVYNLCLPGIISNLRKAQQIECQYTLCLKTEVPQGVPPEACDAAYAYSSCVYKTGNLFFWAGFIDQFVNMLKSLVNDPISTAGMVAGMITCLPACNLKGTTPSPASFASRACTWVKAASRLGAVVGQVVAIKDDWTKKQDVANDYCAQAKKLGFDTFG